MEEFYITLYNEISEKEKTQNLHKNDDGINFSRRTIPPDNSYRLN